jgi:predicted outer membrane repeat protein
MHLKLLRAAAAVAVLGGTATLGLGVQAAMAATTSVDCNTTDLITAMTDHVSGDTLVLAPHCTYWVTAQLPSVMDTLTIEGNGATIDATTGPFSIFVVGCTTGDLTLENVNVKNGGGSGIDGGAVDVTNSSATLNVYGGTFSNNSAVYDAGPGGYGGAISNEGTLTVDGATFTDNGAEYGGAIYSDNGGSTATLDHDSFIGNNANEGGAIFNEDNNMQVGEGNFRYNSATGEDAEGGAIFNDYNLTVNDTLLMMNTASGLDAEGGAVYNDDENVTINHSLIEVNRASYGGGGGGIYWYNDDDGSTNVVLHFDQINQNYPDNCEPHNGIDGCTG